MSRKLGISRTAIWKNIKGLIELGYQIDSVPGKGYKLAGKPDSLYPWELKINDLWFKDLEIYHFDQLTSTNEFAKSLTSNNRALVIAEEQTAGKGRRGRQWFSGKGGIYCSYLFSPRLSLEEITIIPVIAALSVSLSIESLYDLEPKIKWPNDVLINKRKVSGILVELIGEPDKIARVVVGVGINVNQNAKEFKGELETKAVTLKELSGKQVDRKILLTEILTRLEKLVKEFNDKPDRVIDQLKKYSCVLNREVIIESTRNQIKGTAVDLDSSGALILKLEDGSLKRVMSGDVSLRM